MRPVEYLRLGKSGPRVTRLALGCWAIGGHGWGAVNDDDSVQTIRLACDVGVNFFDTADVYGLGRSESLLSSALGEQRQRVTIATKGGIRWDSSGRTQRDSSPTHLRQALEASLGRLRLDCLPLYYVHWPDERTPIGDTVEAMARFREEGLIQHIGVSNFTLKQLREALRVTPIDVVQVQFSILDREATQDIIPLCQEAGAGLVTWGCLADGLLAGKFTGDTRFSADDHRSRHPNFQGDLFLRNLEKAEALRDIAAKVGVTMPQLALRWVLDTPGVSVALFGAKYPGQLRDNLGSYGRGLPKDTYQRIAALNSK